MFPTTPPRADSEINDLADLVVGEVVRVGAMFADDSPTPQLIEGVRERIVSPLTDVRQQRGREFTTDDGGNRQQVSGGLRQLRQPRFDDGLQLCRGSRLVRSVAPSG